jgi:hypothetical protein
LHSTAVLTPFFHGEPASCGFYNDTFDQLIFLCLKVYSIFAENIFSNLQKIVKRILSYNVNGIRSAIRKGFFLWLEQDIPDILCLQEIKARQGEMSEFVFEKMGYWFYSFPALKPVIVV